MKKLIFISILFLVLINFLLLSQSQWGSYSQDKVNINTLVQYGNKWFKENGDTPYSGIAFDLSKNTGNKILECHYNNGKQHGKYMKWNEAGNQEIEGNYKSGKKDGNWTYYYENGQKKSEGRYKEGNKNGKWTYYNQDGNLEFDGIFQNGEMWDGTFIDYYENGSKKEEGNYKNGKKNGLWIEWKEYNREKEEFNFINNYRIINLNSSDFHPHKITSNSHVTLEKGVYDLTNYGLRLSHKENIIIEGNGSKIITKSRWEEVISIYGSNNITITNVISGHEVKATCGASVVSIGSSENIVFDNCDLYGSGETGLKIYNSTGVEFKNSIIRECTSSIIEATDIELKLIDSKFYDNQGSIKIMENSDWKNKDNIIIAVSGCTFINNQQSDYLIDIGIKNRNHLKYSHFNSELSTSHNITIKNCVFKNNSFNEIGLNINDFSNNTLEEDNFDRLPFIPNWQSNKDSVIAFQIKYNMTVDGIWGIDTQNEYETIKFDDRRRRRHAAEFKAYKAKADKAKAAEAKAYKAKADKAKAMKKYIDKLTAIEAEIQKREEGGFFGKAADLKKLENKKTAHIRTKPK